MLIMPFFTTVSFSYIRNCRSGCTLLNLIVSFLSVQFVIDLSLCGMVQYCRSIFLQTCVSISPSFIFFKEYLKDCTARSALLFVAGWYCDTIIVNWEIGVAALGRCC